MPSSPNVPSRRSFLATTGGYAALGTLTGCTAVGNAVDGVRGSIEPHTYRSDAELGDLPDRGRRSGTTPGGRSIGRHHVAGERAVGERHEYGLYRAG